jgi:hypothetical protein
MVEVFGGTRSHADGGAKIGAGLGFAAGIAMGVGLASDDFLQIGTGEVLALGGVSALFGAMIGALVGLAVERPVWAPIQSAPVQVRAAFEPRRAGLTFRVSF